jgi:hypothetical protein
VVRIQLTHLSKRSERGAERAVEESEDDDPARAHEAREPSNRGDRVGDVRKDEPAHERVEGLVGMEVVEFLHLERHMGDVRGGGARPREGDGLSRPVDAENRPAVADEPPREERDVAGPAARVENPHPRLDAGAAKHLLGQLVQETRLLDEAPDLGAGFAEDVQGRKGLVHRDQRATAEHAPGASSSIPTATSTVEPTSGAEETGEETSAWGTPGRSVKRRDATRRPVTSSRSRARQAKASSSSWRAISRSTLTPARK